MESSTYGVNYDQPNGTTCSTAMNASDTCSTMMDNLKTTFLIYLCVSVIITVGLAFIVRRQNYRLGCCWGRPGVLQPVNFIDEVSRRWAYAACFVIMTNHIFGLIVGNEEWKGKFGWVNVLIGLFTAMAVCLVYYPLLACINHRRSMFANALGVVYLIPWITIYSCVFYACPIRSETSLVDSINTVIRIWIYIAFYVVGLFYILDFVKNIKRRRNLRSEAIFEAKTSDNTDGNLGYSVSHHFEHVVDLLRPRKPEQVDETNNAIILKATKLIKRLKYEKMIGFRYSTRLVCCTTTAATLVIWMVALVAGFTDGILQYATGPCKEVSAVSMLSFIADAICEFLNVTRTLFHVANAVSGFIVLVFMINTLVTYKRRWHQLLRGDHSWHMYGSEINSPSGTMLDSLKYAGFQVAYALWGWLVLMIVLFIVLMFVSFAFIIPLKKGEMNWFITFLKNSWPTVLLAFVIAVIQRLICRFLFLQDKGSLLAINNRRLYNAASYYFLLLNVIVGFFSCLQRILVPFALGVLFLSRLDQPLVLKGYETLDPGYVSFVSMLLVDLYHNHPVVKAFVELLLKVREQEQPFTGVDGETVIQSEEKRRRSKLIRNRWWKMVTLANNPSLVLKVLEENLKNERNNVEQANVRNGLSSIEMHPFPEDHEEQFSFA